MNPNFHSLSVCLDLILNQNFLIPFLFSIARVDLNGKKKLLWCLSSMKWHSWVIPEAGQNLYSLPTLRTSVQTFQTYLMKGCSSLVFTTLFYHSSTTYFVLLRLSLLFSCWLWVQVFALPGLAVTLNGVRWFCGMQKISHLRQNWLLIAREVFLVNHMSCGKD